MAAKTPENNGGVIGRFKCPQSSYNRNWKNDEASRKPEFQECGGVNVPVSDCMFPTLKTMHEKYPTHLEDIEKQIAKGGSENFEKLKSYLLLCAQTLAMGSEFFMLGAFYALMSAQFEIELKTPVSVFDGRFELYMTGDDDIEIDNENKILPHITINGTYLNIRELIKVSIVKGGFCVSWEEKFSISIPPVFIELSTDELVSAGILGFTVYPLCGKDIEIPCDFLSYGPDFRPLRATPQNYVVSIDIAGGKSKNFCFVDTVLYYH